MSDPVAPATPTDTPDAGTPAPEEQPATIETGAWMGERDAVPSETPDPDVP